MRKSLTRERRRKSRKKGRSRANFKEKRVPFISPSPPQLSFFLLRRIPFSFSLFFPLFPGIFKYTFPFFSPPVFYLLSLAQRAESMKTANKKRRLLISSGGGPRKEINFLPSLLHTPYQYKPLGPKKGKQGGEAR